MMQEHVKFHNMQKIVIKNSNVSFTKIPMGHNKLDGFVKNMAAQAGLVNSVPITA